MNILITSASRKVWLIKAFKEALKAENIDGNITAYDQDENATGFKFATELLQPKECNWLDFLLSYIEDFKTDCIVPTRDGELESLSILKKAMCDNNIIVSDPYSVNICRDKLEFNNYCNIKGFPVPNRIIGKYFSKPFDGAGSKGTHIIDCNTSIVQEYCDWPEYTIDVFIHPDGTPISSVPRQRIKVIDGESWVGKTVKDEKLIYGAIELCKSIGLIWHNTVQCFYNGKDIKWIEVNPRFGGGAALGFAAGHHTPQYIVKILAGRDVKPCIGEFKGDLTMYKYTDEVYA